MDSSQGDDDDGDPDESRPVLFDPEFVYCHRAVHKSTLDPHLYCSSCGGIFPVISGMAITAGSKYAHELSCRLLMAARRTSSSKFNDDDDDDEMQDDGSGTSSPCESFHGGDEGRSSSEDCSSARLDDDDDVDDEDGDSTDTSSDASDVLDGARGGT